MSKADVMVKFHVKRDELSQEIKEDAERILKVMDLDSLLQDPKSYLTQLGALFMEVQNKRLDEAFEMGRKYGRDTTP